MKNKFFYLIVLILVIIILVIVSKNFTKKYNQSIAQNITEVAEENFFLLYIDNIEEDENQIKIFGDVEKGKINLDDEISIEGLGGKGVDCKVEKLQKDDEEVTSAKEGEYICIVLDTDISTEMIQVGQSVTLLGTTKPIYNFNIQITSTDISLSELVKEINKIYIKSDINCSATIVSEEEQKIRVSLEVPIVIENDVEVLLKNNEEIIGEGIINENK